MTAWRGCGGLQTDYEYDPLGRMTLSKPSTGQGGYSEYVYSRTAATAAGTAGPSVHIRNRGNSKTASVLDFKIYFRTQKERIQGQGTRDIAFRDGKAITKAGK